LANNAGTSATNDTRTGRVTTRTKSAFKTTEFIAYVVVVLGVLIASAVVDNDEDGSGFDANHAWMYVTFLTVGYMISRGLAKSGSRRHEDRTDF
jgi:hypothetical protein